MFAKEYKNWIKAKFPMVSDEECKPLVKCDYISSVAYGFFLHHYILLTNYKQIIQSIFWLHMTLTFPVFMGWLWQRRSIMMIILHNIAIITRRIAIGISLFWFMNYFHENQPTESIRSFSDDINLIDLFKNSDKTYVIICLILVTLINIIYWSKYGFINQYYQALRKFIKDNSYPTAVDKKNETKWNIIVLLVNIFRIILFTSLLSSFQLQSVNILTLLLFIIRFYGYHLLTLWSLASWEKMSRNITMSSSF